MGTRAREVEKFSILSSPGSSTASRALSTLVLDPSDATGPFGVVAELRSREGVNSTVNCTVFGRPLAEAQARGTRTETSVASEQLFPHFVPVRGGMGFERTGARRHNHRDLPLSSSSPKGDSHLENTYPSQYPSPRTSHPRKPRIPTERGVS